MHGCKCKRRPCNNLVKRNMRVKGHPAVERRGAQVRDGVAAHGDQQQAEGEGHGGGGADDEPVMREWRREGAGRGYSWRTALCFTIFT